MGVLHTWEDPDALEERADPSSGGAFVLIGALPGPRSFSFAELRAFPRQELGPTQVNCLTGRPVVFAASLAGVRLTDLLEAAGLSRLPRSELKQSVVCVRGADGYRAVFSWNELFNTALGQGVLLLGERDGAPLPAGIGPLCLISTHDRQLGPRHLRSAVAAEVVRLP